MSSRERPHTRAARRRAARIEHRASAVQRGLPWPGQWQRVMLFSLDAVHRSDWTLTLLGYRAPVTIQGDARLTRPTSRSSSISTSSSGCLRGHTKRAAAPAAGRSCRRSRRTSGPRRARRRWESRAVQSCTLPCRAVPVPSVTISGWTAERGRKRAVEGADGHGRRRSRRQDERERHALRRRAGPRRRWRSRSRTGSTGRCRPSRIASVWPIEAIASSDASTSIARIAEGAAEALDQQHAGEMHQERRSASAGDRRRSADGRSCRPPAAGSRRAEFRTTANVRTRP